MLNWRLNRDVGTSSGGGRVPVFAQPSNRQLQPSSIARLWILGPRAYVPALILGGPAPSLPYGRSLDDMWRQISVFKFLIDK